MTINSKSFVSEFLEFEKEGLHQQFALAKGFTVLEKEEALGLESFNVGYSRAFETDDGLFSRPIDFTLRGTQGMTICTCKEILNDRDETYCMISDMVDVIGSTSLEDGLIYQVNVLLSIYGKDGVLSEYLVSMGDYNKETFSGIRSTLIRDIELKTSHLIDEAEEYYRSTCFIEEDMEYYSHVDWIMEIKVEECSFTSRDQ